MVSEQPFTITVYDKAFARKGGVGAPLAVSATVRHNQLSNATITVAADDRRLSDLTADGARVVILYDGQHLLGGPVRRIRGVGPSVSGLVEIDIEDDFRLLYRMLGWPIPTAALTAQTTAYDVRTGNAETVLKAFVTANATRLGLPVTAATNLNRGTTIAGGVRLRFHPLADRLLPAVEAAGLGVTVRQVGTGLVVDVYQPALYPNELSEQSGVIQSWAWSRSAPTATRVIAGDRGEATARSFTTTVDTARETAWNDKIEVFLDARDLDVTENPTELTERRAEVLADGAPRAGLSLELTETSTFRYGAAVKVGDRIRVLVGPGVVVEDVLREAALSWSVDDGLVVTPIVGDRTDDPDVTLARALFRVFRSLRQLGAR